MKLTLEQQYTLSDVLVERAPDPNVINRDPHYVP